MEQMLALISLLWIVIIMVSFSRNAELFLCFYSNPLEWQRVWFCPPVFISIVQCVRRPSHLLPSSTVYPIHCISWSVGLRGDGNLRCCVIASFQVSFARGHKFNFSVFLLFVSLSLILVMRPPSSDQGPWALKSWSIGHKRCWFVQLYTMGAYVKQLSYR